MTAIGKCSEYVHSFQTKNQNENVKARTVALQHAPKRRGPTKLKPGMFHSPMPGAFCSPAQIEQRRLIYKQSKMKIHKAEKMLEASERAVQVMKTKKVELNERS